MPKIGAAVIIVRNSSSSMLFCDIARILLPDIKAKTSQRADSHDESDDGAGRRPHRSLGSRDQGPRDPGQRDASAFRR